MYVPLQYRYMCVWTTHQANFLSFSEEDLRKTIIDYRTSNIMRGLLEQAVHGPVYDQLGDTSSVIHVVSIR